MEEHWIAELVSRNFLVCRLHASSFNCTTAGIGHDRRSRPVGPPALTTETAEDDGKIIFFLFFTRDSGARKAMDRQNQEKNGPSVVFRFSVVKAGGPFGRERRSWLG
jgi:hypothetical protein